MCHAICLVFTASQAAATLVTYPPPSESFPSGPFNISVTQGSKSSQSFVYHSAAPADGPAAQRGRSMSWTTFSFAGSVSIAVTPNQAWSKVLLRPLSLGLKVARVGSSAIFTLDTPTKVVVEFDGDTKDSLMIFADPPEDQAPLKHGDIQFGPGVHDIGQGYRVPSGATVRLQGGAWVRGTFASAPGGRITIDGRGVLSGERLAHPSVATDSLALLNLCGDDITVRGVTLVNPPTYMVNINPYWTLCWHARTLVEGVKALGWHYTGDGIMVGRNSTVRDCFVRANDDALKLYMSNTLWERNIIWQEDNGQPFMLSWNTMTNERNITVRDCTVVHVEHAADADNGARSVIGAVHGGTGQLSGYRFDRITVEGPVFRAFGLTVQKSPFGASDRGTISDVAFHDLAFVGAAASRDSRISGHISEVAFHGLQLQGKVVTSAAQGHFDVGANVTGVSFSAEEPQKPTLVEDARPLS